MYNGFYVSPGSFVLFSSGLFAILIVYIKEDAIETRKIVYALLASNIVVTLLQFIFGWNLRSPGVNNLLNVPPELFYINAKITIIGTMLLFADSILIIFVFEFISRHVGKIFFRVFLTMSFVLSLDAILFSLSTIPDFNKFKEIVIASFISKIIASFFYSILFTIYIITFENGQKRSKSRNFNDVFQLMTYRQKFENALIEKEKNEIEANNKINENEKKYRKLLDIAPVGFTVHDDGKIIFANPSAIKLLEGETAEDIQGADLRKLIHPDNYKETTDKIRRILNGEQLIFSNEIKYVTLEGKTVEVEVISSPFIHQGKKSVLSILKDISAQKKAERKLNDLNIKLESKVDQKTRELNERISELERFYDATIEREFVINDLKKENQELKKRLHTDSN